MTTSELIGKQKAFNKRMLWSLLVLPISVAVGLVLAKHVENWLPGSDTFKETVGMCTLLGGIVVGMLSLLLVVNVSVQRLGLQCPKCGKAMVGITGQIAVATGKCGFCAQKVVND